VAVNGRSRGKQVSLRRIDITRFADGRIVERWDLFDRLGIMQQFGVIAETVELLRRAGLET